jgi:glycerophosphoryl diester phosphodiesterase
MRTILLTATFFTAMTVSGGDGRIRLIAHRGGVVDESHIEHSVAGVEAAIRRGYWMVEADLRRTADGQIIVHHDATFQRYYGDPRRVSDLPWSEIVTLRSSPGGARPMKFAELAALCRGRIRLMLDIKGQLFPREFYAEIEDVLRKNDLFASTLILSNAEAKQFFRGKASRAAGRSELREAHARGEDVTRDYYFFEVADTLDQDTVRWASSLGVPVVAAVNTFRYEMAGRDHWQAAEQDIRRLRGYGVTYFQFDSIYDRWLLDK